MAALTRHANSGYEMANKPQIKKRRRYTGREETNKHSKKKEEAGNGSEQRDKGWKHVIRVHDTITHLAVTTTARQHTLTNYHTQRKTERSR